MVPRRSRRWIFRLFALILGLSPLVLLELLCLVFGWGIASSAIDPFVGFEGSRPLFEKSGDGEYWQIAEDRQVFFCPDRFLASKPPGEFRIFCLGGSTVQGRPYAIETSFTTWLELSLHAAEPQRRFEVVNCGGISYASYRLVPILDEVLQHQPDLIIVYTGHNEFLEDRSYGHVKDRSTWLKFALRQAARFRSYRFMVERWHGRGDADDRRVSIDLLPQEVEARLDYEGGLDKYQRDVTWQTGVVEHFGFNIRSMIARCRHANVPIWFADPVCNLRNCPPFKSQHRDDLSPAELKQWNALRSSASSLFSQNTAAAIQQLELVRRIDGQHAGLCYDLAKSYDVRGDYVLAKQLYVESKDLDICPLRMTEALRRRLRSACDETRTRLIDVIGCFGRESRDGIPGGYLMVDHVHPSITGHQMIADLLIDACEDEGIVTRRSDWKARRDQRFEAHLKALDDIYFLNAQRRLEGLRLWSQGRARRQRAQE
jgi:lysophospholipase L1-like esterase